jgi:hypothetical protein
MIVELIKIASELDSRGLVKEADVIDALLKVATVGPTHPSSWFTQNEQGEKVPLHDPDSPEYAQLAASYEESKLSKEEMEQMQGSTSELPASFLQELAQLTPEQKEILGDLLMEGGLFDAGSTDLENPPDKGFLDWDKPVGSPTQSLPPES